VGEVNSPAWGTCHPLPLSHLLSPLVLVPIFSPIQATMAAIPTPILPILEFLPIREVIPIRAVEPTVSRR